jgi:hypothetical protein
VLIGNQFKKNRKHFLLHGPDLPTRSANPTHPAKWHPISAPLSSGPAQTARPVLAAPLVGSLRSPIQRRSPACALTARRRESQASSAPTSRPSASPVGRSPCPCRAHLLAPDRPLARRPRSCVAARRTRPVAVRPAWRARVSLVAARWHTVHPCIAHRPVVSGPHPSRSL